MQKLYWVTFVLDNSNKKLKRKKKMKKSFSKLNFKQHEMPGMVVKQDKIVVYQSLSLS